MIDATEIAGAFNQQNDKKTWKARPAGTVVHFTSTNGLVSILYYVETGLFAVKFTKLQAAWGDYVKGIARSLHVILNTLKSAGLPFEAPPSFAGMVIEATTTDDNSVHVRWPGGDPVAPQTVHTALDAEDYAAAEELANDAVTEAFKPLPDLL